MKLKGMENGAGAGEDRFRLRTAILQTLGEEALRYVPRA